jgi:peptidoglycan hydrolase CwlO-like protein
MKKKILLVVGTLVILISVVIFVSIQNSLAQNRQADLRSLESEVYNISFPTDIEKVAIKRV